MEKDSCSGHARRDFLDRLQPFSNDCRFEMREASEVAARTCQARDNAERDRVHDLYEHDRHGPSRLPHGECRRTAAGNDHVGLQRKQLFRERLSPVSVCRAPAVVDAEIAAFGPAQLAEPPYQSIHQRLILGIALGESQKHADAPHPARLLCARGERPSGAGGAEQRDELAPFHSITSSARASSVAGTSMPSIRAVWALMTSSNLVDCSTGMSAGFAPLRMRPE